MPSPESLLERESSRSRTEVDEVEMLLKEKGEVEEEVDSFLLIPVLSLKEKMGRVEVVPFCCPVMSLIMLLYTQ